MRKRFLIIYLIGVIIAWLMGFYYVNGYKKELKTALTYGDIAFVTLTSLTSWGDVIALTIVQCTELEFWDTPIEKTK